MIFVVTVALMGKVRIDNGQPTTELYRYVKAPRQEDIPGLVRNWCDAHGLPYGYIRNHAPARLQDVSAYRDPDALIS